VTFGGGEDDDEFTLTVEGEDGGTFTFGGGSIPDSLQLPVPDGGEVLSSVESPDNVVVTLSYPGSDFDGIVTFYDSQLDPQSDDVTRNESSFTTEDGQFDTVLWTSADNSWTVTVSTCFGIAADDLDSVCVSIFESSS
jgi:hypothetical protein